MVYPIAKLTIGAFIRLFIKKINGKENVLKNKPFIVTSNHASFFDDLAIPSIIIPNLNKKMHFYVNAYYFNNYFLRKFLEWGESIPVDPTKGKKHKEINKKAFQTALRHLKNGEIVGIFPEGTRSIDGELQQAKSGIAKLAIAAKVPVLPIGIIDSHKILPKGKLLLRLKRCKINIGKPLYFKEYYNKKINKKILGNITRTIMKNIAELTGKKYNH
ncbi:MAG: lysophospholipid acyltransferase family protein [Candidatus Woesearchaeota archaeon]|jgi:1-acyl-sn-glycerol-3-phosphate acyltransferase|nr:lysophospholipid acyltransferase family protein [Candidatus Woesearchaeota archaeon]|tara:strand:- start:593 stop:1240 length:648 start_codon:yes stop_codon:yes gene_type:complete